MEYRPGIPDEEFIGGAPMTKQEVRAVVLSKARIGNTGVVYDIGSGCGSITVEAGLLAREGRVFSIERDVSRISIIEKNLKKFGVNNVVVVMGEAPEALADLPLADAIIVGGSGGKMRGILKKSFKRLRHGGMIVVNAVTLDSLSDAISTLDDLDMDFDVTQVSISKGVMVAEKRLMMAFNPVFILDARR